MLTKTVALTIVLALLGRMVYLLLQPEVFLIQFVPDDAFYYLELAQNRIVTGLWSFDGVEPATGFHLLFAYELTGIIAMLGESYSWKNAVIISSALNLLLLTASAALLYSALGKVVLRRATGALVVFLAPAVLLQSTLMMESTLVIFCATWLLFSFISANVSERGFLLSSFLAGFVGALARSDFGLLPAALFVAHVLLHRQAKEKVRLVKNGMPLAGAIAGTLAVLGHNYLISGEIAQASAKMKLYWSGLEGHSPVPILVLGLSLFLPLLIVLPYFIWEKLQHRAADIDLDKTSASGLLLKRVLALASCLCLGGYAAFYSLNSASLQVWYVSNLVVPAGILLFLLFDGYLKQRRILRMIVILLYGGSATLSIIPPWPHQAGMLNAAHNIAQNLPKSAVIGVWNAGIIGHVSGQGVVNIDGLVNDTIYEYIVEDRLLEYLKLREIDYVVDYEAMLTNESKVIRSGLSLKDITRCLKRVEPLDGNAVGWRETQIILYEFVC